MTTSLQARSAKHTHTLISKRFSLNTSKKGSLTVEAALVVPLFLFVMINIMSVMEMISLHSRMEAAMHQTGKVIAEYGFIYSEWKQEASDVEKLIENVGFSNVYVKNQVVKTIGSSYLESSIVKGGVSGISFLQSSIMNEDIIDLVAIYKVSPRFSIVGINSFSMVNRCRMRAWTGYDNTKGNNRVSTDEMVYITETGTVYHKNRTCSHLNLSISLVFFKDIINMRNSSGCKYYECEVCGKKERSETVYITKEGNRYHSSLDCSGLKRTIHTIPISEVGARSPCSRCGQTN